MSSSAPLAAPGLNDLLVTVSTVGHAVKTFAPSDHIPVVASISIRIPAPSPTQIPKWIAQHELVHSLCRGGILEIAPSLTPLEKLARVKEIFWQTVPLFKYRLKLRPPNSTCEKLHFVLMAFRGWRMGVLSQCVRAIRVYPFLLQFFEHDRECCTDVDGLGAHVQTLKDSWHEMEERALDD